ncbi:unnamed protein product [Trichogramma brassicae]|uniref:Uncharacterized protein n=1 Tax=Trichogramma brassicae TaxID=86971 RepID=A0A6H5I7S9_9HYME|nr:unnamed protein product [Trichogramma brassicae]
MTLRKRRDYPRTHGCHRRDQAQLDSIVAQVNAINLRCKKIEDLIADANKKTTDTRNALAATRAEIIQLKEYLLIQPSTEMCVYGLPLFLPHDTTEDLSNIFKSILNVLRADRCHQDVLRYKLIIKSGPASARRTDDDKPSKSARSTTFSFVAVLHAERVASSRHKAQAHTRPSETFRDCSGSCRARCRGRTLRADAAVRLQAVFARRGPVPSSKAGCPVYQEDGQLYARKTRDTEPIGIFTETDLASIV